MRNKDFHAEAGRLDVASEARSTYLKTALYCGGFAAVASLATIAVLSRSEGHSAVRPINATSHVIAGPADAPREEVDVRHTLPGLAINVGSAFFWGAVAAAAMPQRSRLSRGQIVGRAFATALVAGIVDYGIVPRRLRPGWELALKPRSVAGALAAMGFGLAAGALVARSDNGHRSSGEGR